MDASSIYDRLVIRGELQVPQALHVGSGEANRQTDAAIRRDAQGEPYIPGSSLGGLLRAAARDLAPFYFENPTAALDELFGSVKQASRVWVDDAYVTTPLPSEIEVRDHVGVDRRRGAARPNLQYDNEVTPGDTCYRFEISIEEPTKPELGLLLAVLDFWSSEFGLQVGGRTTSGLGQARLVGESLEYFGISLDDREALRAYLLDDTTDTPIEFLPEQWRKQRADLDALADSTHLVPAIQPDAKFPEAFRPQHLLLTVALLLEEPLLVQAAVAKIPDPNETSPGAKRTADADFVTALVASGGPEQEYIPGSSLKGVLRARAEKIVRTLNLHHTNADTTSDDGYRAAQAEYTARICACAVTHRESLASWPESEKLLACFGTETKQRKAQKEADREAGGIREEAEQAKRKAEAEKERARNDRERDQAEDALYQADALRTYAEQVFASALYEKACVVCRLFGNSVMRGRLSVGDAQLIAQPTAKLFDHVAIDRFYGGAEDKQKFDTRPMMPKVEGAPPRFAPMFAFNLRLERFEPWMLGLLGHILKDLYTSDLRVGHATHRGYGRVRGIVTRATLLVLPGSELEQRCSKQGLTPTKGVGPYRCIELELPRLFGTEPWAATGLSGAPLDSATARLLNQCNEEFQALVQQEERRPHGTF